MSGPSPMALFTAEADPASKERIEVTFVMIIVNISSCVVMIFMKIVSRVERGQRKQCSQDGLPPSSGRFKISFSRLSMMTLNARKISNSHRTTAAKKISTNQFRQVRIFPN